jgi:hypothetical protein
VAESNDTEVGECQSGFYRIDAAQRLRIVAGEALPSTFHRAVLDGEAIQTRAEMFTALAGAFQFPNYFGRNWDAVYDCLTDLSWTSADGFVLVLDGCERFAAHDPEQWRIGKKVFRDVCAFWRPLGRPFLALIYDPVAPDPALPSLPPHCLTAAR